MLSLLLSTTSRKGRLLLVLSCEINFKTLFSSKADFHLLISFTLLAKIYIYIYSTYPTFGVKVLWFQAVYQNLIRRI